MSAKRQHDLVDFYLGFAFGLFGVAAFLVGSWSHGYLHWLSP